MKKTLLKSFNRFGYTLAKTHDLSKLNSQLKFKTSQLKKVQIINKELLKSHQENLMAQALLRLKDIGINPSVIIDVGAAEGEWTKLSLKSWPNASYHLIEPLTEQGTKLKSLMNQEHNIQCHFAVAGNHIGEVQFSVSENLLGSGVFGDDAPNKRALPTITIDSILNKSAEPNLIKLDTHGFELEILKGSMQTLRHTEALIIEVYGFYISPTAPLFHQLSSKMEDLGFRLYDIVSPMRREVDKAFWQADAVYLPSDNPVFSNNSYD